MDKMPVNAQSFEHKEAPLYRTAPWTYAQELGAQVILANGGALVTGPAGTGKSYLPHKLKELVPDAVVCAYMHTTITRLIGGNRVANVMIAQTHGACGFSVAEVSLLPLYALGNLARLKPRGAKFVLFGDSDGQFESVADRWSVSSGRVQQTQLLRDMAKSLRVKLKTYRAATTSSCSTSTTGSTTPRRQCKAW